jgi:hypothetical protein
MWGRLRSLGSALFLGDSHLDLLAHWSVRLGIRSTIDGLYYQADRTAFLPLGWRYPAHLIPALVWALRQVPERAAVLTSILCITDPKEPKFYNLFMTNISGHFIVT